MKRSGLGAGAKSLERRSTFASPRSELERTPPDVRPIDNATAQATRKRKPAGKVSRAPAGARVSWVEAAKSRPCAMGCGQRATQGHHIVTQQELRRALRGEFGRFRWDLRNMLPVCNGCHAAHHARQAPIPMRVLRVHAPGVFAFAVELDRAWWLERVYPESEAAR